MVEIFCPSLRWSAGAREPRGIAFVVDRDGDLWAPTGRGAWFGYETVPLAWDELLEWCGPVRQVINWYTRRATIIETRSIYATPRRFTHPQPEPAELGLVTDADGFRWAPAGNGWWFGIEEQPLPWAELLRRSGSLAEVSRYDVSNEPDEDNLFSQDWFPWHQLTRRSSSRR